jgi:hypothetical protein
VGGREVRRDSFGDPDAVSLYDMPPAQWYAGGVFILANAPIRLVHGDFRTLLREHRFPPTHRIVAFLAPPWAAALTAETGLDLSRTKPPIGEIIDAFERVYPNSPVLHVVEVHEHLVPEPLSALRDRFAWSQLNIYDLPSPTGRHGVLLGTNKRWQ